MNGPRMLNEWPVSRQIRNKLRIILGTFDKFSLNLKIWWTNCSIYWLQLSRRASWWSLCIYIPAASRIRLKNQQIGLRKELRFWMACHTWNWHDTPSHPVHISMGAGGSKKLCTIGGKPITSVTCAKYSGIVISNYLKIKQNTGQNIGSALRLLWALKRGSQYWKKHIHFGF